MDKAQSLCFLFTSVRFAADPPVEYQEKHCLKCCVNQDVPCLSCFAIPYNLMTYRRRCFPGLILGGKPVLILGITAFFSQGSKTTSSATCLEFDWV